MTRLNTRQAAVLLTLLKSKEPSSARALGKKLGLPARVIRYTLPFICSWLEVQGISFTLRRRKGLYLEISETNRAELIDKISQGIALNLYSAEDRLHLLLFELLAGSGWHSGADLLETLSISHSTLTRDLDRVEEWLATHQLNLSRRPRLGIMLEGDVIDQRHALISLLFELDLEAEMLNYILWGKTTTGANLDEFSAGKLRILTRMDDWDLSSAWRMIGKIARELDTNYPESAHLYLALYWALMLWHCKQNYFIQMSSERLEELFSLPESQTVTDAAELLYAETGLRLRKAEQAQLVLELLASSREMDMRNGLLKTDEAHVETADAMVKKFVAGVSERMGLDLNHPDVNARLAEHLSRVLVRLEYGMPIRTKLGAEIQQAYPELWKASFQTMDELEDLAGHPLPKQEASYLTMYMSLAMQLNEQREHKRPRVIVVCPSGGVTVWMLVSRLRKELPELKIIDVVALKELGRVDKSQADAILTTAKLTDRELPVVTISPILTEEDIRRIREVLKTINGS
jgi:mannitol operon transcriptional antiterminator